MAVPSKAEQINRVADVLAQWIEEDVPIDEAAKRIVNGMYDMWQRGLESPPMPIVTGQAFKLPWTSTIYRVTWEGEAQWFKDGILRNVVWVTSATTSQGTLALADADVWRLATPSSSKAEPKPNASGYSVGDVFSLAQGRYKFVVVAVHERCVLLRGSGDFYLTSEPNDNIKRYYRKEG